MPEPVAKKSLGQHWLKDQASLLAMTEAAELSGTDCVLEIGPGLGTLTELLVNKAGKVIAVEKDEQLAVELRQRLTSNDLEILSGDILELNLNDLPPGYKVVANIPYYLTSNLIRVLSESPNPPQVAVLLVQKEVAERIAAQPGAMSLLSVTAQFYWQVSLKAVVPAKLFSPPPKVDSQIVVLNRLKRHLYEDVEPKAFFRVTKAGFSQRRKTLLNSLSAGLKLDKTIIAAACSSVGIAPGRRAQTLSLDEWHNLYISLNT